MQVGVVVTHQPGGVIMGQPAQDRDWSSGICACFEDCESCALTYFCCPFYVCCCLSRDMGENCCTQYLVPDAVIAYRVKIRAKYNIRGSIIQDCCCFCWCTMCTVCQLAREVKYIERQTNAKAFPM